jgi:large subunit ribosomal protein L25
MMENVEVESRSGVGSRAVARLRGKGLIPAVLYGHGEANLCLSVKREALDNLIKHGTKLVMLSGGASETAILREVQWDTYGTEIIHVDFARVSQTEMVTITLPVELHGEAPGLNEGGQLRFASHEITIACPAVRIPESIRVTISSLGVGQAIHAGEVTLPEGAKLVTPSEVVIVSVFKPAAEAASDAAPAAAT